MLVSVHFSNSTTMFVNTIGMLLNCLAFSEGLSDLFYFIDLAKLLSCKVLNDDWVLDSLFFMR